jgi:hypothetical protein
MSAGIGIFQRVPGDEGVPVERLRIHWVWHQRIGAQPPSQRRVIPSCPHCVDAKGLLPSLPCKTIVNWKGAIFGPAPPLPAVGQVPALGHLVALDAQHQAGRVVCLPCGKDTWSPTIYCIIPSRRMAIPPLMPSLLQPLAPQHTRWPRPAGRLSPAANHEPRRTPRSPSFSFVLFVSFVDPYRRFSRKIDA